MSKSAAVRSALKRAFDDTELVSLCQDHFSHLCEKFGDGMGKEQKLNIIVDNFLPSQDFAPLIQVVKDHYPDAYNHFQSMLYSKFGIHSAYELVSAYKFDMTHLVQECIESLYDSEGLVGFAMPNYSQAFLGNFHERLRHDIGRGKVSDGGIFSIQPLHRDVEQIMSVIARRFPLLRSQDVLLGIQADSRKTANDFWKKLNFIYEQYDHPNRLIVVIGVKSKYIPNGPLRLDPPSFKRSDIHLWIKMVVESLEWSESMIDFWIDQMLRECVHENQLDMDLVFQYIKDMTEILKFSPTQQNFQQELEQRRQLYDI